MPPHVAVRKAATKLGEADAFRRARRRDRTVSTYLDAPGALSRYWRAPDTAALASSGEALAAVTSHYLAHRFDLLGSGWVRVAHGIDASGFEGIVYPAGPRISPDHGGAWLAARLPKSALPRATAVWSLVDTDYVPIDWQLDVKSGWRWSEQDWFRDVPVGHRPGADVKVPWELGRMQHLPQLAMAAGLAGRTEGLHSVDRYAREFRNQVLDFIATNPPRFGANWALAMDVAMRVVSWLVAWDVFRAFGTRFDDDFEDVLAASVLDHASFIAAHHEWAEELHGNHYLANVVGLLFAAAYLPRTATTDTWLAFATRETLAEIDHQFWPDGGGFEASVCYHRLSAEMAAWAVALLLALPAERLGALADHPAARFGSARPLPSDPIPLRLMPGGLDRPIPTWLPDRLSRMAAFTRAATRPNGLVAQIGDNDSGRFLRLVPSGEPLSASDAVARFANLANIHLESADYWWEDPLDHGTLVETIEALFEDSDDVGTPSGALAHALIGDNRLPAGERSNPPSGAPLGDGSVLEVFATPEPDATRWREIRVAVAGGGARDGLEDLAFPDFGLWVIRSKRVWLAIRCGPIGQQGNGGHAHNDQLAIELAIDGVDLLRDPGSYVYTASPDRRNAYRSATAHAGPRLARGEPARLDLGLFTIGGEAEAHATYFGPRGFAGEVRLTDGARLAAFVELTDAELVIRHRSIGTDLAQPHGRLTDLRALAPSVPFSPGYGVVERA
jgi:hypothetical protein